MAEPSRPTRRGGRVGGLAAGAVGHYVRGVAGFSRDARLFLVITILFGSAMSLYWTDFNLYVKSVGLDDSTCGWLLTVSQIAGVAVALPASAVSDRIGRRSVMVVGIVLVVLALLAFLPGEVTLLFLGVAAMGAGGQIFGVVQVPYIAEHTRPEQRNDYFSMWQAIQFSTAFLSTIVGGAAASWLAPRLGLTSASAPYELLLLGVATLGLVTLVSLFLLSNDRSTAPAHERAARPGRFGLVVINRGLMFKLLLPGFLTSLGAGQLIPFLNLFVSTKFNLGLAEVNAFFAIASLGTAVAILAQPYVARKFGRIGAIVLVQGASIPFIVVLGFSPILWSVVLALAVRNSLMNAGSPIFDAFAMDRVSEAERATLSAGMSMLWSLGWTIAPMYYSTLQSTLGFTTGYAVDFVTTVVLYSIATSLLWRWFHADDRSRVSVADASVAVPAAPTLATGEG